LRRRGTAKRWMRCIFRSDFAAKLTRSAIFPPAAATSSVMAEPCRLKVNCPVGARETTLGCPHKGKLSFCAAYRIIYANPITENVEMIPNMW